MEIGLEFLLQLVSYALMILGLVGTVAPLLPGPILIWLGCFLWAWVDGFERVSWPTLLVLALFVGVAMVINWVLTVAGARWGGASWRGLLVASVAAVAGFLVFNFIGAVVAGVLGLLGWEAYQRDWRWREAARMSGGAILGYVVSVVMGFGLGVAMLAVFAWQAFGG